MTLKVCQDPLNPRPGGGPAPPRTPNLAPMLENHYITLLTDQQFTHSFFTFKNISIEVHTKFGFDMMRLINWYKRVNNFTKLL